MKNAVKKITGFFTRKISRIETKSAVQYLLVTVCSCMTVLAGAAIYNGGTSYPDGQGGFETPGIPLVNEESFVSGETLEQIAADLPPAADEELFYQVYRVKPGDMIGHIAENFGISQDTIISVNSVHSSRNLQIGTYLKIPSMPGILYTVKKDGETLDKIAEKYSVELAKCASVNNRKTDENLSAGTMIYVPGGKLSWAELQEINGDLFKKPIHARWYKSSSFGWRASPFTGSRSYHSGIDMACPTGTWIYAALDGKVTATGFNNTYGNYVIITHHSGYKTLYGHMSAITAVKGQYVNSKSKIGKVGSTGMSTGPHLHFTVYKNGKAVNPVNLWN